jgi:hypothetical protein
VMVWSSAKPHNVDDMVDKALRDDRRHLAAVWARDTFGLTPDLYSPCTFFLLFLKYSKPLDVDRKTQTIKDLRKPWAALANAFTGGVHSALTTLLLDDSPKKAACQPHNHLCVPEYTQSLCMGSMRELAREKKEGPGATAAAKVDPTLLAVIGVLDTLKFQNNVAGWVRAGGLWPTREQQQTEATPGNEGGGMGEGHKLWFEEEETFAFWVGRGREALRRLDIAVDHGLDK